MAAHAEARPARPTWSRVARVVEGHARVYRRVWRGSLITSFVAPLLYLAAMGLGLGSLVDRGGPSADLGGITYLEFFGPGLLVASAFQMAAGEGAWPVMAGLKWRRTYHATLATPIGVSDLVVGHAIWLSIRTTMAATAFAIVMTTFGVTTPGRALLAVPPAVLTGAAVGMAMTAYASHLKSEQGLSTAFRFGVVPMFLFSGAFFPIEQLPDVVEPVAIATPLWHGVVMARGAALGQSLPYSLAVHVGYLALWVTVATVVAVRGFHRRLTP